MAATPATPLAVFTGEEASGDAGDPSPRSSRGEGKGEGQRKRCSHGYTTTIGVFPETRL
jgi:hypothetical protein